MAFPKASAFEVLYQMTETVNYLNCFVRDLDL